MLQIVSTALNKHKYSYNSYCNLTWFQRCNGGYMELFIQPKKTQMPTGNKLICLSVWFATGHPANTSYWPTMRQCWPVTHADLTVTTWNWRRLTNDVLMLGSVVDAGPTLKHHWIGGWCLVACTRARGYLSRWLIGGISDRGTLTPRTPTKKQHLHTHPLWIRERKSRWIHVFFSAKLRQLFKNKTKI